MSGFDVAQVTSVFAPSGKSGGTAKGVAGGAASGFAVGGPIGAGAGAALSFGSSLLGGGEPKTQQHGRYSVGGELAVMTALIQNRRWADADAQEREFVARGGTPPTGHKLGGLVAKYGPQTDFSPISVKLPNGETIIVGTGAGTGKSPTSNPSANNPAQSFNVVSPGGVPFRDEGTPLNSTTLLWIAFGAVLFLLLLYFVTQAR